MSINVPSTELEQITVAFMVFDNHEATVKSQSSIRDFMQAVGVTEEVYNKHLKHLMNEISEQLGVLYGQIADEQSLLSDEETFESNEEVFVDDSVFQQLLNNE